MKFFFRSCELVNVTGRHEFRLLGHSSFLWHERFARAPPPLPGSKFLLNIYSSNSNICEINCVFPRRRLHEMLHIFKTDDWGKVFGKTEVDSDLFQSTTRCGLWGTRVLRWVLRAALNCGGSNLLQQVYTRLLHRIRLTHIRCNPQNMTSLVCRLDMGS